MTTLTTWKEYLKDKGMEYPMPGHEIFSCRVCGKEVRALPDTACDDSGRLYCARCAGAFDPEAEVGGQPEADLAFWHREATRLKGQRDMLVEAVKGALPSLCSKGIEPVRKRLAAALESVEADRPAGIPEVS